jgi:hypothetical protein
VSEPLMIRGRPPRSTVVALLGAQGLPISDITGEYLEHFFFVGSDGSPTGLVGLELYGGASGVPVENSAEQCCVPAQTLELATACCAK